MKKRIVLTALFLFTIISGLYFYVNKDFRNIACEKSAYYVTATILQNDFNTCESLANKKYLDKTINVKGKITSINILDSTLEIDEKILVVCTDSISAKLAFNQQINVKGRFIGYDDLFHQFRLDQVIIED